MDGTNPAGYGNEGKSFLLRPLAEIYTATQHEFSHCVSTCLSATGFTVGEHSGRGAVLKAKCFFLVASFVKALTVRLV